MIVNDIRKFLMISEGVDNTCVTLQGNHTVSETWIEPPYVDMSKLITNRYL